jgi:regulator of RNase E activity RraA
MDAPLTAEELAAIKKYDTCTVANAIETFNVRPRNQGFMSAEIKSIFPEMGVMVGYAAVGQIRSKEPAKAQYANAAWFDYIMSIPAPRVVVLQDMDDPPGVGSFWGEVQGNIHYALGCVGVVTNGGVRDLTEVRDLGFNYFAKHVLVSHAYVHMIDHGKPVVIGGQEVKTGDLIHGDQHGVHVVPTEIARDIPRVGDEIFVREHVIIDYCKTPEFTLDGLKKLRG